MAKMSAIDYLMPSLALIFIFYWFEVPMLVIWLVCFHSRFHSPGIFRLSEYWDCAFGRQK